MQGVKERGVTSAEKGTRSGYEARAGELIRAAQDSDIRSMSAAQSGSWSASVVRGGGRRANVLKEGAGEVFRGLSEAEAEHSRASHGSNKMSKRGERSLLSQFLSGLGDPIIKVLLLSLALNVVFTIGNIDWLEVGGMALAILLATGISTLSERSSRRAFEDLSSSAGGRSCRARRDGRTVEIEADDVVVGDILLIGAGESIAADGVLVRGKVSLEQSALTGESKEAQKSALDAASSAFAAIAVTEAGEGALSAERAACILAESGAAQKLLEPSSPHSCLRGATVSAGEGEMLVVRVGDASFLGSVVSELQGEVRSSPLKERLSVLARQISRLGYGAALIIAVLSLVSSFVGDSGYSREVILSRLTDITFVASELIRAITLGLTVVVMAVPEGLPMMIAVVLSSNVKRMLSDMVLVRKSAGIEAAGSMNILFTDKTGTLTAGKMKVEGLILPDGSHVRGLRELRERAPRLSEALCEGICKSSSAEYSRDRAVGGNATERALVEYVRGRCEGAGGRIIKKQPFDPELKLSYAVLERKTYIKGAPDILAPHVRGGCAEVGSDMYAMRAEIANAQRNGKRVILICESDTEPRGASLPEMRAICAAVISDPPRREARASVERLRGAGIGVVMITGDGALTAKSIAESTGVLGAGRSVCLEHSELDKMSDSEIAELLPRLAVVARALPSDKSRLVRICQSMELVVGMTGDGINDAPALRAADVGFAMGDGSDIAKDACDVVILDNDLASIVKAVLYGRNIFKSIRKFIVFQLTVNFSSALVCMIGPLLGVEAPITVTQMLWVNMIMDTLGGLAFAGEAAAKRDLREKPKRRDERIVNKYMLHQILISGSFSVVVSLLFLKHPFFTSQIRESEGDVIHLSAFFALFIFLGVAQCINSRTDRLNLFSGIAKNRAFVFVMCLITAIQISFVYFGGSALRTAPLTPHELLLTILIAASAIPFEIIRKICWRLGGHTKGF